MTYFPNFTQIIKYINDSGDLNILILEFIDSKDIKSPHELIEVLHKYCYAALLKSEEDPFYNCRNIEILQICPYPPEDLENKLIKIEGDIIIDLTRNDLLNGSIIQALLGSPDQEHLPKPLILLDSLFRAEILPKERRAYLTSIDEIDLSEQTFEEFLELSKILYNLSFHRDPNEEIEFLS